MQGHHSAKPHASCQVPRCHMQACCSCSELVDTHILSTHTSRLLVRCQFLLPACMRVRWHPAAAAGSISLSPRVLLPRSRNQIDHHQPKPGVVRLTRIASPWVMSSSPSQVPVLNLSPVSSDPSGYHLLVAVSSSVSPVRW